MKRRKYDTLEVKLYSSALMMIDYDLDGVMFDADSEEEGLFRLFANSYGEELLKLEPEDFEKVKKGFIEEWENRSETIKERIAKIHNEKQDSDHITIWEENYADELLEIDKVTVWIRSAFTQKSVQGHLEKIVLEKKIEAKEKAMTAAGKALKRKITKETAGMVEEEIENYEYIRSLNEAFEETVRNLRNRLFPETYDMMGDSYGDSKMRRRGQNPMSEEYTAEVNERRKKLGFQPLGPDGLPTDHGEMMQYCRDLIAGRRKYEPVVRGKKETQ